MYMWKAMSYWPIIDTQITYNPSIILHFIIMKESYKHISEYFSIYLFWILNIIG